MDTINDRAEYSADMKYRYLFERRWAQPTRPDRDMIVWVLLNPGTGDTDGKHRPTLDRCIKWSKQWGYSGLTIVNLFALRSTDPKVLKTARDPIGPKNGTTIRRAARQASRIVVAWGDKGSLLGRGKKVAAMLSKPYCLGVTKHGEPRHPLYVPTSTEPRPFA